MTSLLSHAVIYRGIVYYNTIVMLDGIDVRLVPYREECEATSFVNGVLLFVDDNGNPDSVTALLDDILCGCDGLEEVIDSVRSLSDNDRTAGGSGLTLFALWPDVRIMARGIGMVVCR
ncbi:MAG: hypothetical protein NC117_06510 [Pseudoflavonifractor sp.]|nr:hypothetical protein [Pseudoflavonifractor sp.]